MDYRAGDPAELDIGSMLHPFTALARHQETGPRVMMAGEGAHLTDRSGRRFLDGFAGLWCVNIGYGRREMADAVARQIVELSYIQSFASMANEPSIRLASRIQSMVPMAGARVFFGCSGSDANDTNVKLVWHYNNLLGRPRKKKIIARRRAYHGSTIVTGCLSGLPTLNREFDEPTGRIRFVSPACFDWRPDPQWDAPRHVAFLLDELEQTILNEGPDTVAAFLAEPLMGAGGVAPPPPGYWEGVQAILKRHDVLLIADEVISGFGRLGRWFGCDRYGISPDLMTLAKGLTSGYVPLSASVVSEAVWAVLRDGSARHGPFGHGFTYSAHPVAAAAAMANLDILEREDLVARAARLGAHLAAALADRFGGLAALAGIRSDGLVGAIELAPAAVAAAAPRLAAGMTPAQAVVAAAAERGVLVRALNDSNIIATAPAFIVSEADIDTIVAAIGDALEEVVGR